MKNVTLICPTYRNPEYLDLFLKSATENRNDSNNKILVSVDGYVQESVNVINKYKDVLSLELEINQGMQTAINYAVMQTDTEYVFICNDDNVLPKNWDTRVLTEINRSEYNRGESVVLTVNQVEPTGPGMYGFPVVDFGKTYYEFQYDAWLQYEASMSPQGLGLDEGRIFPFVVQKKWYMAIGGLDTYYCSPQVCDYDMFLKWELLNFKFTRTYNMHLYHFGSVVTRKNKEAPSFRLKEDQAIRQYSWKWGAELYNHPYTNSKFPVDNKFRGFFVK